MNGYAKEPRDISKVINVRCSITPELYTVFNSSNIKSTNIPKSASVYSTNKT